MSDIIPEAPAAPDPAAELEAVKAQLAEAQAQLAGQNDELTSEQELAQLRAQLAETQADLARSKDALASAQASPAAPADALAAHAAPSKVQEILDAVDAGTPIVHDDLVAAKQELQYYLDTAGPMKALVDAWERLRQL